MVAPTLVMTEYGSGTRINTISSGVKNHVPKDGEGQTIASLCGVAPGRYAHKASVKKVTVRETSFWREHILN